MSPRGCLLINCENFHVDDVGRIADMLEAHEDNLGWYLTQDPKGKKIPHFLGELSQELCHTHLNTLKELTSLNYFLEQLEYLLTAGQTPDRAGGFKDTAHFAVVMDEAVVSHQGELDRMGIEGGPGISRCWRRNFGGIETEPHFSKFDPECDQFNARGGKASASPRSACFALSRS